MRKHAFALLVLLLTFDVVGAAEQTLSTAEAGTALANLPLVFELNRGQAKSQVSYVARATGMTVLLEPNRTTLVLNGGGNTGADRPPELVTIDLVRSNHSASAEGIDLLPGKSNYFIGKDPAAWLTAIPQFRKVAFRSVYPGIDVVYYGSDGGIEYDFILRPGADPDALRFRVTGGQLTLSESGNLILQAGDHPVELQRPLIYQEAHGKRFPVDGHYVLLGENEIALRLEHYDAHKELVIDPVLSYSTLIGANMSTTAQGVAIDPLGNVYVTGTTFATDYPTVAAFQTSNAGSTDVFVTKLSATGNQILYSTYLGGSTFDTGRAIAVDAEGSAYLTGNIGSGDFPTTPGAFMTTCPGACNTPFVTKFATDGTLVYSTYMGGSNNAAWAIAVDTAGDAFITGSSASNDMPLVNAFQTTPAGVFVQKLNPTGSALDYSTYLGGGAESGRGIAVDATGSAHVVGSTSATDFPVKNPLQASVITASTNAFITKFSPDGKSLIFSTYYGGRSLSVDHGDEATGVAVDQFGNVHVIGTSTSCDFPLTLNALSSECATTSYEQKVFTLLLTPAGDQVLFSTFLRGGFSYGIAVDGNGNSYITGTTSANDFPVLKPIESTSQRSSLWIGFVSELDLSGKLFFSTYLGATGGSQPAGIAVDSHGGIYVAGAGQGDFPLVHPIPSEVLQNTNYTLFVAKISPKNMSQISLSPRISPTLTLRNVSTVPLTINSIVPSPNFTQGGDCGTALPPGGGCTLIEEGANDNQTEGSVTVTANGVVHNFAISKSRFGDNVGSAINIFPLSLQFPLQFLGTTSAIQKVVIRNPGLQPGAINSIAITPAGVFNQTNDCPPLLNPAGFCTISVTYAAATALDTAGLTIVHDPNMWTDNVGLTGHGSASAISAATQFVEFGTQFVGQPILGRLVNLTNTTPYPATVTGIVPTAGFQESDTCTQALTPHASCRALVSYQPTTNENAVGTLTVNNYGPGGPSVINLAATGLINGVLAVSPIAVDFPQATINQVNGPHTVTLTNVSSAPIPIIGVQVADPFSQTNNCPSSLAVGATCQLSVFFTPTQLGAAAATLSIVFTGTGSPQLVSLTGTAVTIVTLTPSPLDFGQQQVGVAGPETFLSVTNSSSQAVTLKSFTVQGSEFSLLQNLCPSRLRPHFACALLLVFTPSTTGLRTGTVTVDASDYAQPHVAPLQGTGVSSGQLSLSVTSLDFGEQRVGTISGAQAVVLTNTGSGPIIFSGISTSPDFFRVKNNCGGNLAAGASCSLNVRFAPTLRGMLIGTLTVQDDSLGNPHTIALTGIGQ